MKKTSLKDIARELNVSSSAVSLTLNGKGNEKRISKDTQKKIFEYAKKQNYKPNSFAKGLAKGKSEMIGLIVPNISDVFFSRIARRIEKFAENTGYDVIFSSTGENADKESKKIQTMLDRQVDGLIIASSQKNTKDIQRLKRSNFPFVLIDREYPEIKTNFVGFKNIEGVSAAVDQLIQSGRQRIAFVTLSIDLKTIHERLDGYVQTMEANGLAIEDGFIHKLDYNNVAADISNAISLLANKKVGIDAIVFSTQFLAAEGIRILKGLQIKIPDDIAIISYGQKKDFDLFEPSVSEVNLPINQMGDTAVNILLNNMSDPKICNERVLLETKLVVRKSSSSPE